MKNSTLNADEKNLIIKARFEMFMKINESKKKSNFNKYKKIVSDKNLTFVNVK